MYEILKEIVAYFLFLMLLLLAAYGNRDPNTYLLRKTLHETFVDLDQLSVDLADVCICHAFSSKYKKIRDSVNSDGEYGSWKLRVIGSLILLEDNRESCIHV